MSERRHDRLTGETVILATHRKDRPHAPEAGDASPDDCPFCPGQEHQTPEAVLVLPEGGREHWSVRVFPNRYPIVTQDVPEDVPAARVATGIHEVVVETPIHDQEMAQRPPEELALTLTAYRLRLASMLEVRGIRYVAVFKNKGPTAGNSLAHPHSQIAALSYVPEAVSRVAAAWRRHHTRTGRCLLCEEVAREREQLSRVVLQRHGFIVFAPYASTRPGELLLAPLRHQTSYATLTDKDVEGMSEALSAALRALAKGFDDPDYNLVLQTWPAAPGRDEAALHWYLRILPRIGVLGGFELATGDYVSTLSPEQAAAAYQESLTA